MVATAAAPGGGTRSGAAAVATITGEITGDKGDALPGTAVLLKDTQNGTTTNGDGRYAIAIPEAQAAGTLVVSCIGYVAKDSRQAGWLVFVPAVRRELQTDCAQWPGTFSLKTNRGQYARQPGYCHSG